MNRFNRTDRVSKLIHKLVSNIIENELRDRILGMVTVTGVDIGRDLKNAHIYVSVLGDDEVIKSSLSVLNHASGFIRSRIAEKSGLRFTPAVVFFYDSSTVDGMHIDKLLNEINNLP